MLVLTTVEVAARPRGDWAADVAAHENIHTQILHTADMLSAGITGLTQRNLYSRSAP